MPEHNTPYTLAGLAANDTPGPSTHSLVTPRQLIPAEATELIQETVRAVFETHEIVRQLRRAAHADTRAVLSFREAANRLRVDRNSTLLDFIARGDLRTVTLNGRKRILAADVQRLTEDGPGAGRPRRRARTTDGQAPSTSAADAIRAIKL